jgi:hypothetical protein
MSSLVIELQQGTMDPNAKVSDLLRKALVVATKLGLEEFRSWIELELKGYGLQKTPEYRKIRGEVKADNPYHGWIPVVFKDAKVNEKLSERATNQSIAEIEDLLSRDSSGKATYQTALPPEIARKLGEEHGLPVALVADRSELTKIVEAVRSTILEWSLKLEKEGIFGEGMTFSKEETEKAAVTTFHIQNFTGIVGGVTAGNIQFGDYNSIHSKLKQLGVPQAERNELETILDELRTAKAEKKQSLLKRGIDWVKRNKETIGTLAEIIRGWFGG